VLWAAGQTETTRENIQGWLQLDGRGPGFELLTEEEITAVISFYLFSSAISIILNFPFLYYVVHCLLGLLFH
jgi:hypothetical protein